MRNPTPRNRPGESPVVPASDDALTPTVLAWRPLNEWGDVGAQVIRSDANIAQLLLGLVRETAAAAWDEGRLFEVITEFSFRAFPNATHLLLAERDASGQLRSRIARARAEGDTRQVQLSATIADRVMRESCALLYARDQQGPKPLEESVVLARLETAICAPLMDRGVSYGVLQLDVRRPSRGRFTREDVDLLSVFASQVGLALEHLRMVRQQKRAFESTLDALVHSLMLKDPDSARHSERVRAVATAIGRQLGRVDLEVLSAAALLHELGEQGLRHDHRFRSGPQAADERAAAAGDAAHAQSILDRIQYPEHLRDVPRVAAYHNARPGSGPPDPAEEPVALMAQVVAVADVCDTLLVPNTTRRAMRPESVLELLARGRGTEWDARVVDAAREVFPEVLAEIYGVHPDAGETPGDAQRAA